MAFKVINLTRKNNKITNLLMDIEVSSTTIVGIETEFNNFNSNLVSNFSSNIDTNNGQYIILPWVINIGGVEYGGIGFYNHTLCFIEKTKVHSANKDAVNKAFGITNIWDMKNNVNNGTDADPPKEVELTDFRMGDFGTKFPVFYDKTDNNKILQLMPIATCQNVDTYGFIRARYDGKKLYVCGQQHHYSGGAIFKRDLIILEQGKEVIMKIGVANTHAGLSTSSYKDKGTYLILPPKQDTNFSTSECGMVDLTNGKRAIVTDVRMKTNTKPSISFSDCTNGKAGVGTVENPYVFVHSDNIIMSYVFENNSIDTSIGDTHTATDYLITDNSTTVRSDTKSGSGSSIHVPLVDLVLKRIYGVQLRVKDACEYSVYTAKEYFVVNNPPSAINTHGSSSAETANTCAGSTTPRLTWTYQNDLIPGDEQVKFNISITNVATSEVEHNVTLNSSNKYYDVPEGALKSGTVYGWRVKVFNNIQTDQEQFSTETFFLTNMMPEPPIIFYPLENIRFKTSRPTLEFKVSPDSEGDAQGFQLLVADNPSFENPITINSFDNQAGWKVANTNNEYIDLPSEYIENTYVGRYLSYTFQNELEQGQYYFKVRGRDFSTKEYGVWSEMKMFRINNKLEFKLANPIGTEMDAHDIILNVIKNFDGVPRVFKVGVDNPSIVRVGSFIREKVVAPNENNFDTYTWKTSTSGDYIEFEFYGSEISIMCERSLDGVLADVYIDNSKHGEIDFFGKDDDLGFGIGYTVRNLSKEKHTIKIVNKGSSNIESTGTVMKLDHFIIKGNSYEYKLLACNNGFDESPTWEDITTKMLNKDVYHFSNKVKTNEKWGVDFKLTVDANDCLGDIFVDAVGITFS